MRYSEEETKTLAAQINETPCLEDLNALIQQEGCLEIMPIFTNNEVVINMDCVERIVAKVEDRQMNKSMDCAFVITEGNLKEVLLAEFRFNYSNLRNLDKSALTGKVDGTLNLLKNEWKANDKYYFIFNSNMIQQAIRRFRNYNPRLNSNYIATDINGFQELFFNYSIDK